PHELTPEVPRELWALVMRLLEKSPARRPATAADVVQALAQLDLTAARRKTPRRWWRRVAVVVGGAAGLLGGGGVIYRDVRPEAPEGATVKSSPDSQSVGVSPPTAGVPANPSAPESAVVQFVHPESAVKVLKSGDAVWTLRGDGSLSRNGIPIATGL